MLESNKYTYFFPGCVAHTKKTSVMYKDVDTQMSRSQHDVFQRG